MKHKEIFLPVIGILFVSLAAYAINTVIVNIVGNQSSTGNSSYPSQEIRTIGNGDLKFVNRNNDANRIGDYFVGYYYDSAYGRFSSYTGAVSGTGISIQSEVTGKCPSSHSGYLLNGYAFNPEFGFTQFHYSNSIGAYLCIPKDDQNDTLSSYFTGYTYSKYIGFQNFNGISLDSTVDVGTGHLSEGRYVKIEGVVSSKNGSEAIADQFTDDVRMLGNVEKSSLKNDLRKNVYSTIGNIPNTAAVFGQPSGLGNDTWDSVSGVTKILNDAVLVYKNMNNQNVILGAETNIEGNKTLIVEGGNVYISGNIRNSDADGILGIISLEKDGKGGNIYIDPSVTDIHAVLYADRSVLNYKNSSELAGNTSDNQLANQLYIKGSLFSENTIGGTASGKCPYYINGACDAKKYDLNFLRRYILVQPVDADGNPVGGKITQFGGLESYLGDNDRSNTESQKSGYRKFPLIIEYDTQIQTNPPILF